MKKTVAFLLALAIVTGAGVGVGMIPMQNVLTASAEPGDHGTQETAAELTNNTAFVDALIDKVSSNWYKVSTEEDGALTLSFEHDKYDSSSSFWVITVYQDADGKVKELKHWNIIGTEEITRTDTLGLPAGDYYIEVKPYNSSYYKLDNYELTANFISADDWETEFNDTQETADPISVNKTYNGLLHTGTDVDWYTFKVEKDGHFTVDFMHDKLSSSSNNWIMTVYQETDGKLKAFRSWNSAGNTEKTTSGTLGVPEGNYYIEIKAANAGYYSLAPYELRVNFTENGDETQNDWETEFNDLFENADTINVNQTYSGQMHDTTDTDWYQFTTDTDGHFTVQFKHDRLSSSSTYWKMTIYQLDGDNPKKFATWDIPGNEERYTTCGLGVPAGEYYIELTTNNVTAATEVPYDLTVEFTPNDDASNKWETEFNDYKEYADPINVNESICGTIYYKDDKDWYQFSVEEDTKLALRFEHDRLDNSSTYWIVTLYQGNDKLQTWNIRGNETLTLTSEIDVTAGEYHVEVTPYNSYYLSASTYTLRMVTGSEEPGTTDPDDPDDPGTTEPSNPSGGLFGDVDGDGAVNSSDAAWILIYAAEVGAGNTSLPLDQWIATQL